MDLIIEKNTELHNLVLGHWLSQDLFSVKWWGLLGFILLSYVICFWIMKKERLRSTILFGALVSVFTVIIDIFGCSFILWEYTMYLFPIVPSIFFYDITALPLYYMLIFQYTKTWKAYSLWIIGAAVVLGFGFTPIIEKLGYVRLTNWSYLNASLAFIFIGIFSKAVNELIQFVETKYKIRNKTA